MLNEATIQAALESFQGNHDVPGVAVATFDAAGPVAAAARGVRSLDEPEAPMRPDTVFRVYSVAKSLTATLVAQLVDAGAADWDEPITEALPGFSLRGGVDSSSVTLRHLLSHRAGFVPDAVTHHGHSRDPEAVREAALGEPPRVPLVAPPGRVYSYSNLGFTVAGHVAEVRAGLPFGQLATEYLFEPLGMTRSTHDFAEAATYPLLQHHSSRLQAGWGLEVVHEPRVAAKHAPSSACWSTVVDMARFGSLHLAVGRTCRGRLLSMQQVRELHRPHADVRLDVNLRYGLGFYVGPRSGEQDRVGHEGFYDGMWTKLVCDLDSNVGLVWADNRGEELREARYEVIEALLVEAGARPARWARADAPGHVAPPPQGRYERPAGGMGLELSAHEGGLLLSCAGREVRLKYVASDVWADNAPSSDGEPPWRPHAGSRRIALGAVRADSEPVVTHVLLNGVPFRLHQRARS